MLQKKGNIENCKIKKINREENTFQWEIKNMEKK